MWLKITHCTKKKENHNFGEKRQSTMTNTEIKTENYLTKILKKPS